MVLHPNTKSLNVMAALVFFFFVFAPLFLTELSSDTFMSKGDYTKDGGARGSPLGSSILKSRGGHRPLSIHDSSDKKLYRDYYTLSLKEVEKCHN